MATTKLNQYLTFKLEENECAIEVENVKEVLEYRPITPIPRTAEYMRGIINLRGSGIPIVDLHIKFRLNPLSISKNTAIIVMEAVTADKKSIVFGALADSVQEVIEFDEEVLETIPRFGNRIPADFLKGIGKKESEFIAVLDIDKIFSAEEVRTLESTMRNNSNLTPDE
ncbi:MAG: chemotaxis protein CheW [Spirochaetaceae bacterium]|nr:chemotaxis protein CheW [Spirochaetaceae bacterium]